MTDIFDDMDTANAHRLLVLRDKPTGLKAIIALDNLTYGLACGGIRTKRYKSTEEAMQDVQKLASAMTLKCSIAGVPFGGGKSVILDHDGMDRAAAFRKFGEFVEELGGSYMCAGDLGTTQQDLMHVAETTQYVNTAGSDLGVATGITVVNGIRACLAAKGNNQTLADITVAVQGCGLIGAAVARLLAEAGANVLVADINDAQARQLADEIGATVIDPDTILTAEADIISPCAIGGVITPDLIPQLKAWAICGGANNQLFNSGVSDLLVSYKILYVPDFLASSGGVIKGVTSDIMDTDPELYLAKTYDTALEILTRAAAENCSSIRIGTQIALDRLKDKQALLQE
ncbi:Glu/Leu/Phe/Val dehydrogenase dimerization domain-containing protein [Kordiimonas pumila]|uniref:Glu/Leu/Phe/Val dehydrogenase dimerization domain-containing protein n=1 Tax=Kordiimonas pumila TaxID=2161677 RepID=A0ABV7D3Y0_9PROT|nr:Glu/Leu/Phe/Val dehydrogenase dimerization domain-containing protein [Kordiimonas pumila]